jgi:hypothetical protein
MNGFWLASRTSVPLTLNGPVTLPHAAPAAVVAVLPVPPPLPAAVAPCLREPGVPSP